MLKRYFRRSFLVVSMVLAAGLLYIAPFACAASRPPRQRPLRVNLQDTGRTVALPFGQDLIVTVPLKPYDDNYWYVSRNSGGVLKLIAGPDERRPANWTPMKSSVVVFYFQRVAPGTASLVLEQAYFSRPPMILRVVDR
jgi:hypothetical protein